MNPPAKSTARQFNFNNFFKSKAFWLPLAGASILAAVIGGYLWYQGRQTVANPPLNKVEIRVSGMAAGSPIKISNNQGQSLTYETNSKSEIQAGQYRVIAKVDGVGELDERIDVQANKDNLFEFKLTPSGGDDQGKPGSAPRLSANTMAGEAFAGDLKVDGKTVSVGSVISPGVELKNGTKPLLINQAGSKNEDYMKDLVLLNADGSLKPVVQGCVLYRVSPDNSGQKLRYFKTCEDSGENGFYSYDLTSGEETLLLTTSDPVNLVRTDIDPNSDTIAFTKPSGEFGLVREEKVDILMPKSYFSAPKFSPDGKYLLVLDNYLARPEHADKSKPSDNNYETFGLKIKAVEVADLLQNRDQAVFRELGKTYYVPRPDDYYFEFWKFLNATDFQVGDSPRVFNLNGETVKYKDDSGKIPGRLYSTAGGEYRYHLGIIYDVQNRIIATGVDRVLTYQNKLYLMIHQYLMRIEDGQLVQAYPSRLLASYIQGDKLILFNDTGQRLEYQL